MKTILTPSKVKPLEYAGQTIILPVVGEVTFTDTGNLEVDEEVVESLVAATETSFGFFEEVPEGSKKPKGKVQVANEEYEKTKAELDTLSSEDLINLAKESGIAPAALMGMTDGKIKKELLKKLLK